MNLDALVATVEDDVLPGLAYSLGSKRGAAYVKERNFSTFHPSTSNTYSIPSQRVIRVVLSDSGSSMLDLSTVRVACTIKNTGTRDLYLTGRHLACMFQRATVRVKGVITDDVSYYHRLVGTLMNLRPLNSLYSDGPSQLGTGFSDYMQLSYAGPSTATGDKLARLSNGLILSGPEVDPIPANGSRKVIFDLPGISLFNSHYLLPIGRFPVELTLELVSDASLVCAKKYLDASGASQPAGTGAADVMSQTFEISDVSIKADTLLLDSAVTANIDEALTGGKPLTLHLRPWTVQRYTVTGAPSFSQIFSRAYSRLLSMFINFLPKKVPTTAGWYTESNLFSCWHGIADADGTWVPGAKPDYRFNSDKFRFQVQLGSQLYPQVPIESTAEAYYQLQKCVGALTTGVGIASGPTYRSTNFHAAVDFEKVGSTPAGEAAFTGQNTKLAGEQLRILFENLDSRKDGGVGTNWDWTPDAMFVICNYDEVCQLRLEGVLVAD
jgi:hypothetical protein